MVDEGVTIGANTDVWGITHILAGALVGEDCNMWEQVFIEGDVVIGNRVTVKCGVQLWDVLRVEDDVFIGPNVTFTNDRFPRSRQYPAAFMQTVVKKGASIGGVGCDPARSYHWRRRNGGSGCRGDQVSAGLGCGGGQSSTAAALAEGCAQ